MQTELFHGMIDDDCIDKATRVLKAITGISDVYISPEGDSATIQFDERLISPQRLPAALTQAGFDIKTMPTTVKNRSGCCGGCGGG